VSGHSDLAIGSRLAGGARTTRSPKRELISRGYNRLLHTVLRTRFSDAQCGFKAARSDAVRDLLPAVQDQGWFFDTELLVLAQRAGLRIHEVPVDWVEDLDSRVQIVPTAWDDLLGVVRLALTGQLIRFLAIGVFSTIAYALLFLALRTGLSPGASNALALALTAIGNTAANRRITFGVRGRRDALRHQLLGGLVFLLALGLTSGALAVLHALVAQPAPMLEVIVLVMASIGATLSRYVCLRWWVFAEPSPRVDRLLGSEAVPRAACGSRPTRSH
jgi:putative flippase GtrA